MTNWVEFLKSDLAHSIAFTIILLITVALVRSVLARRIKGKANILSESQRQSLSRLRNYSVSIIIVLFILIWAVQLKSFALSLAAFAVAIVIAFKEVILCISGSMVIASGERTFKIGDWIEVSAYRGEVIGHNLLTTTVQEVSSSGNRNYTGKTLIIPNSIFLTHSLINLNFAKKYVFHVFEILIPEQVDWNDMKQRIANKVTEITLPFIDHARTFNVLIEAQSGMDMPDVDPVIRLKTGDEGKIFVAIKLFCPRTAVEEIEHKLIELVLKQKNTDISNAS